MALPPTPELARISAAINIVAERSRTRSAPVASILQVTIETEALDKMAESMEDPHERMFGDDE